MNAARALRAYLGSLAGLRRWLAATVSFEEAREAVLRRMETREDTFLRFVRRAVFENPRSPYLPLFAHAQCSYEDLEHGVRTHGIEAELRRLKDAGVWLSLDEFKGRAPIARDGLELDPKPGDFDNPVVRPIVAPGTGGSSGGPVRSPIDLGHLGARATWQAFFLRLADVDGAPLALWYPRLPAPSGVVNGLLHAKLGQPPARWFDVDCTPGSAAGMRGRLLTAGLVSATRLSPQRLPWPERVAPEAVLDWVLRTRDRAGRCAVHAYVSSAMRLSRRAHARGQSLEGVTFHLGAEPVTQRRWDEIQAAGANGWPRYASAEAGTIGVGCGDAAEPGDYHLCRDVIAAIQDGPAGREPSPPLYLTSLHGAAPRVMINAQLGDCARVVTRPCGCIVGAMGFETHLLRVHSIGRVTCEGMTVAVSDLLRIVEDVLCPRHGGSQVDYQWAEREEPTGKASLHLRVSPAVGPLSPESMVEDILQQLAALSAGARTAAAIWREARTVSVVRERPSISMTGKTLPFVREVPG
jgi:hypothetical protein